MSNSKPVRTNSPVTGRSFAPRSAAGVRRPRARSSPATDPRNTTSAESIAASIVGLMVLAADSGTPAKVDSTNNNSSEAKAALARLIAVRFDSDD